MARPPSNTVSLQSALPTAPSPPQQTAAAGAATHLMHQRDAQGASAPVLLTPLPSTRKLLERLTIIDETRVRGDYSAATTATNLRKYRKHYALTIAAAGAFASLPLGSAPPPNLLDGIHAAEAELLLTLTPRLRTMSETLSPPVSSHHAARIMPVDHLAVDPNAFPALRSVASKGIQSLLEACNVPRDQHPIEESNVPGLLLWPATSSSSLALQKLRRESPVYLQATVLRVRYLALTGRYDIALSYLKTELGHLFNSQDLPSAQSTQIMLAVANVVGCTDSTMLYMFLARSIYAHCTLMLTQQDRKVSQNNSELCKCPRSQNAESFTNNTDFSWPPPLSATQNYDVYNEPLEANGKNKSQNFDSNVCPVAVPSDVITTLCGMLRYFASSCLGSDYQLSAPTIAESAVTRVSARVLASAHARMFLPSSLYTVSTSLMASWFEKLAQMQNQASSALGSEMDEFAQLTMQTLDATRAFLATNLLLASSSVTSGQTSASTQNAGASALTNYVNSTASLYHQSYFSPQHQSGTLNSNTFSHFHSIISGQPLHSSVSEHHHRTGSTGSNGITRHTSLSLSGVPGMTQTLPPGDISARLNALAGLPTPYCVAQAGAFPIIAPILPCCDVRLGLVVASWYARFLTLWHNVIIQRGSIAMFLDFPPCPEGAPGYPLLPNFHAEIEYAFALWHSSVKAIYSSFLKCNNSIQSTMSRENTNKLAESLSAALAWADSLVFFKTPLVVGIAESATTYCFQSSLAFRALAYLHLRRNNLLHARSMVDRYNEVFASNLKSNASGKKKDGIAPELVDSALQNHLLRMFVAIKTSSARQPFAFVEDDIVIDAANLLIETGIAMLQHGDAATAHRISERALALAENAPWAYSLLRSRVECNIAAAHVIMSRQASNAQDKFALERKASFLMDQVCAGTGLPQYLLLYQRALLDAQQYKIASARALLKSSINYTKSFILSWHLLAIVIATEGEFGVAIELCEVGVRRALSAYLAEITNTSLKTGTQNTKDNVADPKMTNYDMLACLLREQQLNQRWSHACYEAIMYSFFSIKITQSKFIEALRGAEAGTAALDELFRWYKLVFDEDLTVHDFVKIRAAESTRSFQGSSYSLSSGILADSTNGANTFFGTKKSDHLQKQQRDGENRRKHKSASDPEDITDGTEGKKQKGKENKNSDVNKHQGGGPKQSQASLHTAYAATARRKHTLLAAVQGQQGLLVTASQSIDDRLSAQGVSKSIPNGSQLVHFTAPNSARAASTSLAAASAAAVEAAAAAAQQHQFNNSGATLSLLRCQVLARLLLRVTQVLVGSGQTEQAAKALYEAETATNASMLLLNSTSSGSHNASGFSAKCFGFGDTLFYGDLGWMWHSVGEPDKAAEYWRRARAGCPFHWGSNFGLAVQGHHTGDDNTATAILRDLCLHSNTKCAGAWYLLGRITGGSIPQMQQGQQQHQQQLQKSQKQQQQFDGASFGRGLALRCYSRALAVERFQLLESEYFFQLPWFPLFHVPRDATTANSSAPPDNARDLPLATTPTANTANKG